MYLKGGSGFLTTNYLEEEEKPLEPLPGPSTRREEVVVRIEGPVLSTQGPSFRVTLVEFVEAAIAGYQEGLRLSDSVSDDKSEAQDPSTTDETSNDGDQGSDANPTYVSEGVSDKVDPLKRRDTNL